MMNVIKPYQLFFSYFIIVLLALTQKSRAQNSPQDYVDAHNVARAAVGVGGIEWDDQLAAYAEGYADERVGDCAIVFSNGPYGENIASGNVEFLTGTYAVQLWVDQEQYYDYSTNLCAIGKQLECNAYTQVVWSNSVRLGCARVQCSDGGYFVICSYDPPGNALGKRPY